MRPWLLKLRRGLNDSKVFKTLAKILQLFDRIRSAERKFLNDENKKQEVVEGLMARSASGDTHSAVRDAVLRLREEEYQKSCAKSAESSKRKKLRP